MKELFEDILTPELEGEGSNSVNFDLEAFEEFQELEEGLQDCFAMEAITGHMLLDIEADSDLEFTMLDIAEAMAEVKGIPIDLYVLEDKDYTVKAGKKELTYMNEESAKKRKGLLADMMKFLKRQGNKFGDVFRSFEAMEENLLKQIDKTSLKSMKITMKNSKVNYLVDKDNQPEYLVKDHSKLMKSVAVQFHSIYGSKAFQTVVDEFTKAVVSKGPDGWAALMMEFHKKASKDTVSGDHLVLPMTLKETINSSGLVMRSESMRLRSMPRVKHMGMSTVTIKVDELPSRLKGFAAVRAEMRDLLLEKYFIGNINEVWTICKSAVDVVTASDVGVIIKGRAAAGLAVMYFSYANSLYTTINRIGSMVENEASLYYKVKSEL